MNKRFLCGVLALSFSAAMLAQSGTNSPYSQYGLGLLSETSQGFSRGMNGVGLALRRGDIVNSLNPASYSAVDSLTMIFDVAFSGQFTHFKEGKASVNAKNADFEYAVASFRLMPNVGMAAGILPYTNVGYKYSKSTFLDHTNGSLAETYSGEGGLRRVFLGAGWRVIEPLSVGFNASYLWGSVDRVGSTSGSTTGINPLTRQYSYSVSSYMLDFGVQWQQRLNRKDVLTLGATVGVGHNLHADPMCIINTDTMTVEDGLSIPMTYGLGVSWSHRDKLVAALDVTLQQWGKLDFPDIVGGKYVLTNGLLKDRYKVTAGIDYVPNPQERHNLFRQIHYRGGIGYTTPYYNINGNSGPQEFSMSAGFGVPIGRSVLNVSGQWVHLSAKDLITENTFRINIGLTFNERWFAKWKIE